MDLPSAIAALEAAVPDPHRGLPEDVFLLLSRLTPLINVDLLIQENGRTLLTWREDEQYGAAWHIPGGIIRYKETAADRIRACALAELGAQVEFGSEPLTILEIIGRPRTRGHFISLLHRCRLTTPLDESRRAGASPRHGDWQWHDTCPPNLLSIQAPYARFF